MTAKHGTAPIAGVWSIARGAVGAYSVQLGGAVIGLGAQIALARTMGASEYGAFVYAISWLTVLQVTCVLGLDRTALRFASVYRGEKDWDRLRGLVGTTHRWTLGAGVLAGVLLSLLGWFLAGPDNRAQGWTLAVSGFVLPLMAISLLRTSFLQAFRWVVLAQFPEQVLRPLLLSLGVVGVYWVSRADVSSATAMGINLVAVAAAFGLGTMFLYRAMPNGVSSAAPLLEKGQWFKVALPLLLIAALHIGNKKMDILFIGSLLGNDEAGIYGAASRLTDLVTFGLAAVNAIASPRIAEAYAQKDSPRLRRTLRLAAWGTAGFVLPIAFGLYLFGGWLLGLFGPEFVGAYTALLIILGGQIVNAATGSVAAVMTMTGHQNQAAFIAVAVFGINLVLNALLVPVHGIVGAAIATAAANAAMNLAMLVYCMAVIRVNPTVLSRR